MWDKLPVNWCRISSTVCLFQPTWLSHERHTIQRYKFFGPGDFEASRFFLLFFSCCFMTLEKHTHTNTKSQRAKPTTCKKVEEPWCRLLSVLFDSYLPPNNTAVCVAPSRIYRKFIFIRFAQEPQTTLKLMHFEGNPWTLRIGRGIPCTVFEWNSMEFVLLAKKYPISI